MKKYLILQQKRVFKIFPFVLLICLALILSLGIVAKGVISSKQEEKMLLNVAITGDTDNGYLDLGITALKTLDETRFSINIIEMEEKEAEKALSKGELAAYAVLPDDFIENALVGDVEPIKYITTAGAEDVTTLLKNEVTTLITDMVLSSQKGVYAMGSMLEGNAESQMTRLSVKYVNLILRRNELIEYKSLDVNEGLSLFEYYICGLFIFIISVLPICFSPLYINKDNSLSSFLVSKGYTNLKQLLCEFLSLFSAFLLLEAVIFGGLGILSSHLHIETGLLSAQNILRFAIYSLPVTVMIVSLNLMLCEISSNLVGGMLLQFFLSVALCYISGCFYPSYVFPKIIQKTAVFLPTGIAFKQLSAFFKYQSTGKTTLLLCLLAVLFLLIALIKRTLTLYNRKPLKGV